jgi:hypothetical protein
MHESSLVAQTRAITTPGHFSSLAFGGDPSRDAFQSLSLGSGGKRNGPAITKKFIPMLLETSDNATILELGPRVNWWAARKGTRGVPARQRIALPSLAKMSGQKWSVARGGY